MGETISKARVKVPEVLARNMNGMDLRFMGGADSRDGWIGALRGTYLRNLTPDSTTSIYGGIGGEIDVVFESDDVKPKYVGDSPGNSIYSLYTKFGVDIDLAPGSLRIFTSMSIGIPAYKPAAIVRHGLGITISPTRKPLSLFSFSLESYVGFRSDEGNERSTWGLLLGVGFGFLK